MMPKMLPTLAALFNFYLFIFFIKKWGEQLVVRNGASKYQKFQTAHLVLRRSPNLLPVWQYFNF